MLGPMAATVTPVDHTGDVGIEVRAGSFAELAEAAARGMTEILVDPSGLSAQREERIVVQGEAGDLVLRAFLAELLYRFLSEGRAAAGVVVEEAGPTRIVARIREDRIDPARHDVRTELKAVTYHGLEVRGAGTDWYAKVIFDI